MAALITLPQETLLQIIVLLPRHDLLNLCVSHTNLYDCVIARLYHTVHLLDPDVQVYPEHSRLFCHDHSTAINNLSNFARTLESSKLLCSLVVGASFQWGTHHDYVIKPLVVRILKLIRTTLRTLHYGSPEWHIEAHKLYPITSICTPWFKPYNLLSRQQVYPDIGRDYAYSLFTIPTLRHLTIHHLHCQSFYHRSYSNEMDRAKIDTSDVEYISIQDTDSADHQDLHEIMRWPKALKGFQSTLGYGEEHSKFAGDPSLFARILEPQSASLEQLSVDFISMQRSITTGTFGTTLCGFPKLKRISMPRNFLIWQPKDGMFPCLKSGVDYHTDARMRDLYAALPSALEELILNISVDVGRIPDVEESEESRAASRAWIKDVAMHKQELYPSLKRMTLWHRFAPWAGNFLPEGEAGRRGDMLEFLDVSQKFEDLGVGFSYQILDTVPSFHGSYT